MAYILGIDIGSGYCKAVVCEDSGLLSYAVMPSGGDYKETVRAVTAQALEKAGISLGDVSEKQLQVTEQPWPGFPTRQLRTSLVMPRGSTTCSRRCGL